MKKKFAVIFDMDGVLVDTEPVINAAAIRGLREFGVEARPEDFTPFIGAGEVKYIGGVAEKYGVPYRPEMKDRVYEIYLQIVGEMLEPQPGAIECLHALRKEGFPLALASSADRIKIHANLRVAGIRHDLFQVILSAEDVTRKKPAPDIYLKAAERLAMPPSRCIVVEDAINGIEAARAAGMICIAVATTFDRKELEEAGPHSICNDMTGVFAAVKHIVRSRSGENPKP